MPLGASSAAGAFGAWAVPGAGPRGDGANLASRVVMTTRIRLTARRVAGRALAACLVAGALACSIEINPDPDSASRTGAVVATQDSAAGTIDTVPPTAAPDTVPFAPDTAPRPTAAAMRDTTSVEATPAELAQLAATLVVPVEGVAAPALRDSYDEARGGRVHQAIDIHAPRGTPVVAATDGRVLRMHESKAGGLMVYQADASDRFVLMYGHLERYAPGLADGMPVRRGQVIGHVGTSGNAAPDAPHLHFVIGRGRPSMSWWRATPVNPYPLLVR